MRIVVEDIDPQAEEEIIIRCKEMDDSILKLIQTIKQRNIMINANKSGQIYRLEQKDIFYYESVENKVFIYTKCEMYDSKQKLYEIEQELIGTDFIRVSKSIILNLSKIKSLAPAFNGRFEATLKNGEKVIISRQYVVDLKERLGLL